jgi:hypothetical protein
MIVVDEWFHDRCPQTVTRSAMSVFLVMGEFAKAETSEFVVS